MSEPVTPRALTSEFKYKLGDKDQLLNYRGVKVPYPFYDFLPSFETFQADPLDVAIVTFVRAGTTITCAITHMIQNDADPKCLFDGPLEEHIPYIDVCFPGEEDGKRIVDVMKARPPPRTFFTHLNYGALPKSIQDNAKIVCVVRNPKDVIVSHYHFYRAMPAFGFKGTLEDMAELFFTDRCVYAPFFDHVASAWKNREKPNVFFMTFEALLENFELTIKRLAKFLGKELSDEQLAQVVYHCNFNSMKTNDNTNRTAFEKCGLMDFSISPFMRAGKVGGWKNDIPPQLNQRIDEWIAREEERLKDDLFGFQFKYD